MLNGRILLLSLRHWFRYSAVTWNAHRIHYDADYSRDIEGYPATVQNGGLTMTLMVGSALKELPVNLTLSTLGLLDLFMWETQLTYVEPLLIKIP